jgi:GTP:adenosylcobinamide-phosphate guanylyltransferase
VSAPACTALVLAGTRPGGDALARHVGVSHKALIEVGGVPMLARVLAALEAAPGVARILVAIDQPALLAGLPAATKPVAAVATASGPSATVAAVLEDAGAPLLVTTADHALLQAAWIAEFLAAAHAGEGSRADALVALARRESVQAVVPETQRTWLRFADGDYSGCNLFLLRTPAAAGVVRLWQQVEARRKQPLQLLRRLGFTYVLRYRLGWLTLAHALQRLGALAGARLLPVILRDGRAAIDVDKPADLELARRLARPE